MRKEALVITVTTLVMSVFGAFLRWLQDRTAFEEDTGLAVSGAPISTVYVVFSLLMLAGMIGIVLYLRRYDAPMDAGTALKTRTVLPIVLSWLCCAAFALSGVVLMFTAGVSSSPQVQRIFGAAAILCGACFPCLPCGRDGKPGPMGRTASSFVSLFFCYWLVFCYLTNAQNPVLWIYGPEILAVAASTLAFYYTTAWFFEHARPRAALLFLQLAVFLDVCILPDQRSVPLTAMLAATAAVLLLLEFLAISNLREKTDEA